MDRWDGAVAQGLVTEAGWNQLPADWDLFREFGQVLTVPAPDGSLAATAATLPSPGGFGWISMVLVASAQRRKGLATELLHRCIASLQAGGRVPVLDATPAGRAVYRPLGFVDGWPISRWRRREPAAGGAAPDAASGAISIRAMTGADLPAVRVLDAPAFGCDRGELLARLHARSDAFACVAHRDGALTGYLLGRDGRNATQIGPIVAADEEAALALCDHALARIAGAVLIDVLDVHAAFARALVQRGFGPERPYTRMVLGRSACFGDPGRMVAIAGPELG